MSKTLEQLVNEHLQDVTITEDFCHYRTEHSKLFYTGGLDETKMLVSADALFPEYELIRLGVVEPPTDFSHDIILNGRRIDIKVIQSTWFTVSQRKLPWYRECVAKKKVDDFAFLSFHKKRSEPLQPGDQVSLRYIKLLPASKVVYNLNVSRYNGYYYPINT